MQLFPWLLSLRPFSNKQRCYNVGSVIELRRAHADNDKAVMKAYGFSAKMSEQEIVAELMKMYQKVAAEKKWCYTI